jgi:DNA (cytosine-5)-methyltransferase 1
MYSLEAEAQTVTKGCVYFFVVLFHLHWPLTELLVDFFVDFFLFYIAQRYRKPDNRKEIRETDKLVIQGEDPDEDEDEEDSDQKPIRLLDDFAIFDPKHGHEMVTLDALEQDDGVDRQFEAAGLVTAYYENDEDEGQEDGDTEPLYVNLSAILRYSVDYSMDAESVHFYFCLSWTRISAVRIIDTSMLIIFALRRPFYIETQYAWYILRSPSQKYSEHWQHFCTPHRIAQIVISRALERPREDFSSFLHKFESKTLMGRTFVKSDIWENVSIAVAFLLHKIN